jgi:hypothetical protein
MAIVCGNEGENLKREAGFTGYYQSPSSRFSTPVTEAGSPFLRIWLCGGSGCFNSMRGDNTRFLTVEIVTNILTHNKKGTSAPIRRELVIPPVAETGRKTFEKRLAVQPN